MNIVSNLYYSVLKLDTDLLIFNSDNFQLKNVQNQQSFLHYQVAKSIAKELKVDGNTGRLFRFGGPHDGGYVISKPRTKNLVVLSFGVGNDISWEEAVSSYAHTIHLYDHTVEDLPIQLPGATHFKEQIGNSRQLETTSLSSCIERLPPAEEYILKMDIEGAEWITLLEAEVDALKQFSQIVIEFHDFHKRILESDVSEVLEVLRKLRVNHVITNVHPNNYGRFDIIGNHPIPDILEVTYLRKDWKSVSDSYDNSSENSPNSTLQPEIVLKFP